MKIKLKGYIVDGSTAYKIIEKDYCCKSIEECPVINISYENDMPEISLIKTECVHSYEDNWTEETFYNIKKCPFCGGDLSIEIVETEDVTTQYNEISKQADKYYKKANKCDSKSAERKNRQLGIELTNQLNLWLINEQL